MTVDNESDRACSHLWERCRRDRILDRAAELLERTAPTAEDIEDQEERRRSNRLAALMDREAGERQ